jgi:putative transposase
MPRAPRIEFVGAMYHVMSRGNRLERIYVDDVDREVFLKTLGETCRSSGWVVHSFIMMKNHYHLLIETPRPTLVRGMQYLNSTYTKRYNVRHKTYGHLFQGRYKALLVDTESEGYFLTVSDYIHMNPVRAKLVKESKELLKDRWSSIGWLAGVRKEKPEWLSWKRVYGEFGSRSWDRRARKEYRNYIDRRMNEETEKDPRIAKIRRGWCYGSGQFVEEMKERLLEVTSKLVKYDTWNDEASDEMEEVRAERDLKQGMKKLGYDNLIEMERWDRYLLAEWVRTRSRMKIDWLAEKIGAKNRGSLSGSLFEIRKRMENNRKLISKWRTLEKS